MLKSVFLQNQIIYLGHLVGGSRHQLDLEKLHAIGTIKSSKTKATLKVHLVC